MKRDILYVVAAFEKKNQTTRPGKMKMTPRLRFNEWSMTNPDYEPLHTALHKARYDLKNLTQGEAYLICSAAEDYLHLAAHPGTTKSILDQLRTIRRVVKDSSDNPPPGGGKKGEM